ncbi:MAG: hypothetical protein O2800_01315 [Planctomycetota bacterium]|nr:hypothetical protein [Planctomycetota bacterium]
MRKTRRTLRLVLVAERTAGVLSVYVLMSTGLIVLDALVVLPALFRTINFVVGVAALLWILHIWIIPATQFHPALVDIARRIERLVPSLRGRLGSALDFESAGTKTPFTSSVQENALSTLIASQPIHIINTQRARRSWLKCLGLFALVAIATTAQPERTAIGIERLIRPWSGARWPATTEVKSLVDVTHAASGIPVLLQATLLRGDKSTVDVAVEWTATQRDGTTTTRSARMPLQPDGTFEFLLEPGDADRIRFVFSTRDSETLEQIIRFVDPPEVKHISLRTNPPEYAASLAGSTEFDTDVFAAAEGQTIRIDPILEGSQVVLGVMLTEDVPCPPADDAARVHWLKTQVGLDNPPPDLKLECDARIWTIRWCAATNISAELFPTDSRGLSALAPIRLIVDVAQDEPPLVSIQEPTEDIRVLANAVVELKANLSDDIGIAWSGIEIQRTRVGEGMTQVRSDHRDLQGQTAAISESISPIELGSQPGDQLEVRVTVQDVFGQATQSRLAVESAVRRIRIISRAQFEEDVSTAVEALRVQVTRADARQVETMRTTALDRRSLMQQVEVGERVSAAQAATEQLKKRLDQNGLGGEALAQSLREASRLLGDAVEHAGEARDALSEASEETSDVAREQQESSARTAQESVRDDLASAAALLERDEDTWTLRRDIERIAERLDAAQQKRDQSSARSQGQTPGELSPEDRETIESAAAETDTAAQQARDLVEELHERSKALQQTQPERSQALRDAAENAEQSGLVESVEKSAQATRQNQSQAAAEAAANAREALDQLQEDLEQEEQLQLEILKRRLASLTESIQSLVSTSTVIERMVADVTEVIPPLEPIGSLYKNTMAVIDEALAVGADGVSVARHLTRAAEHQATAATTLRSEKPSLQSLGESMAHSTESLNAALSESRAQEQQAEEQAQIALLERLHGRYSALLAQQATILSDTQLLMNGDWSGRRRLIECRRIAEEESAVLTSLDAIGAGEDVVSSAAFQEAHRVAREAAVGAIATLREGTTDDWVLAREETVLGVIGGFVGALAQEQQARDRFARDQLSNQNQNAGGGAPPQGDQDPIPPIAELRVLKALQTQIAARTRRIAEGGVQLPGEIADLSARQKAVADLAEKLAKSLEEKAEDEKTEKTNENPLSGAILER